MRHLLIGQERELVWRQTKIERLTHELALHKHHRSGVKAERLSTEQAQLFEETAEADLAAMSEELEQLQPDTSKSQQPKGQARRIRCRPSCRAPRSVTNPTRPACQMRRIGEDVAETLDYTPGHFTVERQIRDKWACDSCETLVQATAPAHIIDKGIPTAGLLVQVLVARYQGLLPLYRQEGIFGRAGLAIPQSPLAQWVGQSGVHLQPLVDAPKTGVLAHPVLHADAPGGDARPGCGQDAPRLPVVLRRRGVRSDQGGGIRLRRQPRRPSRPGIPG